MSKEEISKILEIWKKARRNYDDKKRKLCKKYKIKFKEVDIDEYFSIFQFENGVEFTVPFNENYDDYGLTGDALKFAEKYNEIIQDCFAEAGDGIKKEGFEEIDSDEYFNVYLKSDVEYCVNHYAKNEKDIEINDLTKEKKNK